MVARSQGSLRSEKNQNFLNNSSCDKKSEFQEVQLNSEKLDSTSVSTFGRGTTKKKSRWRRFIPKFLRANLTRTQWMVLISISVGNCAAAMSFALQAPFYPMTAESKNVTATEYGFVFSSYYLANFIVAPFYGKLMPYVTPKRMLNVGFFVHNVAISVFGFVDYIQDGRVFLGVCFFLRIVEGIGITAYVTASTTILMHEFPKNIGMAFSFMKTAFSVGLVVGPTYGGVLFDLGGFLWPFLTCGILCFIAMIVTIFTVPNIKESKLTADEVKERPKMIEFLKGGRLYLYAATIFVAFLLICFQQATLEPHIRVLGYDPAQVGLFFMLQATMNIFAVPIFGVLCDKGINPTFLSGVCATFLCLYTVFTGPLDFLGLPLSKETFIASVLFVGIGIGAASVCCFCATIEYSVSRGFRNDVATNAMISSLFTFCQCAGSFFGPGLGSALTDLIGYNKTTLVFFCLNYPLVLALFAASMLFKRAPKKDLIDVSGPQTADNTHTSISTMDYILNGNTKLDSDDLPEDVSETPVARHRAISDSYSVRSIPNTEALSLLNFKL